MEIVYAHEEGKQIEAFHQHKEGFYLVTPEYAQYILDNHNWDNRLIKEKRVTDYREAMNAGKWRPDNKERCVFSKTSNRNKERVLSAQHRLLAAAGANQAVTMEFGFTENDELDLVNTIDGGTPRSPGDHLVFTGMNISSKHAALYTNVAKLGIQKEKGTFPKKLHHTGSGFLNDWVMQNINFLHQFVTYPSPVNADTALIDEKNAYALGKAALVFSAWVINEKWGFDEAVSFAEKMIIGDNLDAESPILVAKNYLMQIKLGYVKSWESLTRVRSNSLCKTAIICKAFSRYKKGETMKVIRLKEPDIEKEILQLEAPNRALVNV